jgi:hypothetical protein
MLENMKVSEFSEICDKAVACKMAARRRICNFVLKKDAYSQPLLHAMTWRHGGGGGVDCFTPIHRTVGRRTKYLVCFYLLGGPPSLLINEYQGRFPWGVKWSGCEADHSPPCSAEFKNEWSYTSIPRIHLHGVVLVYKKHRDNLLEVCVNITNYLDLFLHSITYLLKTKDCMFSFVTINIQDGNENGSVISKTE